MNTQNETTQKPLVIAGQWFMPNGSVISSSIKALEINDNGVKFQRINPYYNGATFFLTWNALQTSNWVPVPIGNQLEFL